MAVDLHTHSRFSDGSDPPARVVGLAAAAGLTAFALTDHDGIGGLEEAARAADGLIELVPGVELSVVWEGRALHLLVYWPGRDTPLTDALEALAADRAARNARMVAALVDMGIDMTLDDVIAEAGVGVAGRPHIAAVLQRKGVVSSIPEAFADYLGEGRPAYRGRLRLDIGEAVRLALRSGGVPVVAHPHTLADDVLGFKALFESLGALGIAGVECHYGEYPPAMRSGLAAYADSLGLIATGGSDYHGTYKEGLSVGIGRGDLVVPDDCLDALRDLRGLLDEPSQG